MVDVTETVLVGNLEDIHNSEVVKSEAGTINFQRESHRGFLQGKYVLSSPHDGVVIVHLDSVDPMKIHLRLLHSDSGTNYKLSNYINRYDLNYECTRSKKNYINL